MTQSDRFLALVVGLGFFYSISRLFSGTGGSGLGVFFDALAITSIVLFILSLIILLITIKQVKRHADVFVFLLLGLPMTAMATGGLIESINYNRSPDLTPKYPKPVSQEVFSEDSIHIAVQVDSLVALKIRKHTELKFYLPWWTQLFIRNQVKKYLLFTHNNLNQTIWVMT